MSHPLPCGCIRGQTLCPAAERLWRTATLAYQAGAAAWESYQDALEQYRAHFETEGPTAGRGAACSEANPITEDHDA